eukprot:NODE_4234_length_1917_cov_4.909497.p1 GENE.NODE_4234_length_1917_cov_4.909497~~NODE_4234_length_1917_cov_4.909497.p1  ORF type:complete len:474 (+),score=69.88 NODE_4234_length_1917_cov_4.909497:296-1717(+)
MGPRRPGAAVLILERSARLLHKVRISGGGRCNVTHGRPSTAAAGAAAVGGNEAAVAAVYPRGALLVESLNARHGPRDVVRWFEGRSVPLKTEADGRVFPVSDSSECVVGCFLDAVRQLGIEVRTNTRVREIVPIDMANPTEAHGARFRLILQAPAEDDVEEETITCARVILCCGSTQTRSAKRLIRNLGLDALPTVPSLFSVLFDDARDAGLHGLQGVSVPDSIVEIAPQPGGPALRAWQQLLPDCAESDEDLPGPARGPLLITHVGLSGPAILRLSAWGAFALHRRRYHARLRMNWTPFLADAEEAARAIAAVPCGRPGERPPVLQKAVGEVSPWPGRLPARLWRRLLERCGGVRELGSGEVLSSRPWGRFSSAAASRDLACAVWPVLTGHEVIVRGRRVNKDEFVTAGGADWRNGIDIDRLESLAFPGAHVAGEALDVDGITGGFNFQSAWTTGYVAGRAAADALLPDVPK